MEDMQKHLERLRNEAEECELISRLSGNKTKRELFSKLAAHHRVLAQEVERAIAAETNADTNTAPVK
jgi:hypothetical protein